MLTCQFLCHPVKQSSVLRKKESCHNIIVIVFYLARYELTSQQIYDKSILCIYMYHMTSRLTYKTISPKLTREPWRVISTNAKSRLNAPRLSSHRWATIQVQQEQVYCSLTFSYRFNSVPLSAFAKQRRLKSKLISVQNKYIFGG